MELVPGPGSKAPSAAAAAERGRSPARHTTAAMRPSGAAGHRGAALHGPIPEWRRPILGRPGVGVALGGRASALQTFEEGLLALGRMSFVAPRHASLQAQGGAGASPRGAAMVLGAAPSPRGAAGAASAPACPSTFFPFGGGAVTIPASAAGVALVRSTTEGRDQHAQQPQLPEAAASLPIPLARGLSVRKPSLTIARGITPRQRADGRRPPTGPVASTCCRRCRRRQRPPRRHARA